MSVLRGLPNPLGTRVRDGGVNFAVFSSANTLSLLLFRPGAKEPFFHRALDPLLHKTANIWHVFIPDLSPPFEYLYKVTSEEGTFLVHDPYSTGLALPHNGASVYDYFPRSKCFEEPAFDWEGITKPKIDRNDLILYEMHVKGFTNHPSSQVRIPGTFLGMIEKIPYLVDLGINAVELLPIFEFNEAEMKKTKGLVNFWGYSTVNFFCPMQRYASEPAAEKAIIECKTLIRELHRNNIAVILDVVYNHTAEQGKTGPVLSFKGLGKKTYYILTETGEYADYTGTGNTFNCNNPVASRLIIDSLVYWSREMQIDGFRFDLASIFTRQENGSPVSDPPLLRKIRNTPELRNTLLIAEAWDAGGLYQVGSFPGNKAWAEWNGKYRDTVRRFIKGAEGQVPAFMQALCGSQNLYGRYTPTRSVNFVTAHDGYTLTDLVSYERKYNFMNGENNQDGANDNESRNYGVEGPTKDQVVSDLRNRQKKNFFCSLLLSLGIPMLLSGDEYGHTKHGNNNTYCHDDATNYFLWDECEKQPELFVFLKNLIAFRKKRKDLFCKDRFLTEQDVTWVHADFSASNKTLVYIFRDDLSEKDCLIAFNASDSPFSFDIPEAGHWYLVADTGLSPPRDFPPSSDRRILTENKYLLSAFSCLIAEKIPSKIDIQAGSFRKKSGSFRKVS